MVFVYLVELDLVSLPGQRANPFHLVILCSMDIESVSSESVELPAALLPT